MRTFRIFISHPRSVEIGATGLVDLDEARSALAAEIAQAEQVEEGAFDYPAAIRSSYRANLGEGVSFGGSTYTIEQEA